MIVKGEIAPYRSIPKDKTVILPDILSGFLGGELHGGFYVRSLEEEWAEKFKIKHAIACNSATSGLLAAAAAIGLGPKDSFIVPALTMSATAAAPMMLGATPHFIDVDDKFFCSEGWWTGRSAFVTNLFGHPAIGSVPKESTYVIEDNAQAPFAMVGDKYAGTIGDIGVFSLNVHKHFQCGEGGVVVTDDDDLAERIRLFINHGELAGSGIGLNLRMTEPTAIIAINQLRDGERLVEGRITQAKKILKAIGPLDKLIPPATRKGCKHVYYALAFRVKENRHRIVRELNAEGVPIKAGYLPLTRMPAFKGDHKCPVAERLHDRELILFENCAYSPTDEQIEQIGEAFRKVLA